MATEPTAQVLQAREELVANLNAIGDKLNVPKRVATFRRDKPGVFVSVVAGGIVVAGGLLWAVIAAKRR